ncbi:MAG: hypothetical protein OXG72_09125, partial [Acidobacteria bacterium]|nr:hypothetical protein [Acidobacteriota bacterium]
MPRQRRRGARRQPPDRRGTPRRRTTSPSSTGALLLPLAATLLLIAGAWASPARAHPGLFRSFLAAGGALLQWQLLLRAATRRRPLALDVSCRPKHYLLAR